MHIYAGGGGRIYGYNFSAGHIVWFLEAVSEIRRGRKERQKLADYRDGLRGRSHVPYDILCNGGLLCLFLSTGLIPYTEFAEKIELLQFPERALQYPWRFLSPAGVFLAWLVCILLRKDLGVRSRKEFVATGILCVAFCQAGLYMSDFLSESGALHVYEEENLSTFEVSNKEYFPVEAEIDHFTENLVYDPESIQVSE